MSTARYDVVGDLPIQDSNTGEDVRPGGQVQLDDGIINVRALVEAGLVRPANLKPAKASAKPEDSAG